MDARPNYYEVLGIPRTAKQGDVTRAYQRWVAEFKKETTPPDPRRESLLREAYEVLTDDQRRDAHDAELASRRGPSTKKAGSSATAIGAAAVVLLAAGAAFFVLRPGSPGGKAPKARSAEEILHTMSGSVSALVTYDISGKAAPAGLAWVIEDKVMIANCQAMPPGVQLMVNAGPKQVPARVTLADEALGLCKILTDGYVGEPLAVNSTPPAVGAKVYGAALGAKGEVGLREATVTKVVDGPNGKAIQSSLAAAPGGNGAPLLDAQGKVVAVATMQADGNMLHRIVPAGWLAENRPRIQEPRPYQGDPASATASTAGASPQASAPGSPACDKCDIENDPEIKAMREERRRKIEALPPDQRARAEKLEAQMEQQFNDITRRMQGK